MSTDRELLELAAKAAGLRVHVEHQAERDRIGFGDIGLWLSNGTTCWNPLEKDDHALRLAVKLDLQVTPTSRCSTPHTRVERWGLHPVCVHQVHGTDADKATRRAIVIAATMVAALDFADSQPTVVP